MRRRIIAVAAAMALAVLGVTAWLAGGADATTGTCLNIATPIAQPIGCGGLYFSGLGSGIQPNGTSLTLTAVNPQWNSHVTDTVYDPARSPTRTGPSTSGAPPCPAPARPRSPAAPPA